MPALLIVDDDVDIRETLQSLFEGEGYPTSQATNGAEALTILRAASTPLVVLLDHYMPKLHGMGVLQAASNDPLLARHYYIFFTARHQDFTPEEQLLLDRLSVVLMYKPFDIEEVIDKMQQGMQQLGR